MRKKNIESNPSFQREVRAVSEARRKQDLKDIIRMVMSSPLKDKGEVVQADGNLSLESLSKCNTDVQTRIVMQIAKDAATGNTKSADFLAKYGGMEPPKQQQITMELPTIIDDMTHRTTPVVASAFAAEMTDEEDEDEDEDEEEDI
jgi:hypothetical protein